MLFQRPHKQKANDENQFSQTGVGCLFRLNKMKIVVQTTIKPMHLR